MTAIDSDIARAHQRAYEPSITIYERTSQPGGGRTRDRARCFSWLEFCESTFAHATVGGEHQLLYPIQADTTLGHRIAIRKHIQRESKVRQGERIRGKVTRTGWSMSESWSWTDLGTAWDVTLRQAIEQATRRLRMRRPSCRLYHVTTQTYDVGTEHEAGESRHRLANVQRSPGMRVYALSRWHAFELAYGLTGACAASCTPPDTPPAATPGPVPLRAAFRALRPPRVEALPA